MVMRFGVEGRLSHASNLGLEVPDEGGTTRATTYLTFGLDTSTRTQSLVLDMGVGLQAAQRPGPDDGTDIVDPYVQLAYRREAANSELSLRAHYRRTEVDTLRNLGEFINEDGELDLPDDLGDLIGTGWRNRYGAKARLDLGTSAPLGLSLRAGLDRTSYSGTSDPDLFDSRTQSLEAVLRARLAPVTEGTLSAGRTLYQAEDPEETRRETTTAALGLTHELSPTMTLTGAVGYAAIDTREFGVTTREEGPTAQVGLEIERPNGTLGTDLALSRDQNGQRLTFTVDRAMDLPTGALAAMIGVTRAEDHDPELIGALDWRHDLPRGAFSVRAERKSRSDDNDQITTTALILGYDHELSAVSGITLGASYARIEDTGDNDVDRAHLSAAYVHALTPDWNMNVGLSWTMRDEETVGRATSEEVFVSLSRAFEWRR